MSHQTAGAGIRSLATKYTGLMRASTCEKRVKSIKDSLEGDLQVSIMTRRLLEMQLDELKDKLKALEKISSQDKQQLEEALQKLKAESPPQLQSRITALSAAVARATSHATDQVTKLTNIATNVKDGLSRLSPGKKLYNVANRAKDAMARLSPGKKLYNVANRAKDGLSRLSPGKKLYNVANRAQDGLSRLSPGRYRKRSGSFKKIIYPNIQGEKVDKQQQMSRPGSWLIGTEYHDNSKSKSQHYNVRPENAAAFLYE